MSGAPANRRSRLVRGLTRLLLGSRCSRRWCRSRSCDNNVQCGPGSTSLIAAEAALPALKGWLDNQIESEAMMTHHEQSAVMALLLWHSNAPGLEDDHRSTLVLVNACQLPKSILLVSKMAAQGLKKLACPSIDNCQAGLPIKFVLKADNPGRCIMLQTKTRAPGPAW